MSERTGGAVLFAVLLLVATVPMGATAQGTTRDVLLDEDTRQVATITVDGQPYDVYRVENTLWYASGIEIYADGERVTSRSTAETVLEELAQRRAIRDLKPADLEVLRAAKRNVSEARPAIAMTARQLNTTARHLERLKETRVNGTTAYNASVRAAPALTAFNDSAQDLLPALRAVDGDAETFVQNASRLLRLVELRANGTDVDPQRLFDVYVAAVRANDALSAHFGYSGVSEQLRGLSDQSATIAENVETVPEVGNETAARFAGLSNSSATAANRTDQIDLPGFAFEDIQGRAAETGSQLLDRWQSRQNARSDVRNTLLGLVVLTGAVVGYVGLNRR